MSELRKYVRRADTSVTAVQLDLDTDGFTYRKWDGVQTASAGDWLVNNGGNVYTVERETFEQTYRIVSPGVYAKDQPVWARVADVDGKIQTKEGETHYLAGDMIVFNDEEARDGYAMTAETFERLYEPGSNRVLKQQ